MYMYTSIHCIQIHKHINRQNSRQADEAGRKKDRLMQTDSQADRHTARPTCSCGRTRISLIYIINTRALSEQLPYWGGEREGW